MDFFDAEYATEAAKNAVDLLERMFSQFRYFGPLEGSGTVYLLIDTEISERHLAGALHKHALPPRTFVDPYCEDCGLEIPAARRQAAPWCVTCAPCQSIRERGSRR